MDQEVRGIKKDMGTLCMMTTVNWVHRYHIAQCIFFFLKKILRHNPHVSSPDIYVCREFQPHSSDPYSIIFLFHSHHSEASRSSSFSTFSMHTFYRLVILLALKNVFSIDLQTSLSVLLVSWYGCRDIATKYQL